MRADPTAVISLTHDRQTVSESTIRTSELYMLETFEAVADCSGAHSARTQVCRALPSDDLAAHSPAAVVSVSNSH